jgi:site-specific recombinase XerD
MTALVAPVTGTVTAPVDLAAAADRAAGLAEGARAEATRKAYRADWQHFEGWCHEQGLAALPASPATVGLYVAAHADRLSVATLTRRLSSIAVAHRLAGFAFDGKAAPIRDVMRGLKREKGTAQRHAEALTVQHLLRILNTCDNRLIDQRDRALLLIGYAAALRRSELVALTLDDVAVVPEGLRITIRRSKADQEGAGTVLPVSRTGRATCPVAAFQAWREAAGLTEGRVFRCINRHGQLGEKLSTNAVAEIVQRRAALAGFDNPQAFAGHSMRAGFATTAAMNGLEERIIMRQTRHKSAATVRRYIQEGQLFQRNLSAEVGL